MKLKFAIFIIFLSYGCSINKHFIGKYASNSNPNSFQFKGDSTFLNEYREGHAVKYSKGIWRKASADTVILNSEIKSIDIPLKTIQLEPSKPDNISLAIDLKIYQGLDLSNYHCYIYLNDKVFQIVRCDSISSIKLRLPVESLFFVFSKDPLKSFQNTFPVTSEKVKFNKPLSNDIKIEVAFNDSFFTYHPFNNEKIKVKRNGIRLFNSYLNQWQEIHKVSDRTSIFIHFNEEKTLDLHEAGHYNH
jgi:hypothetical protein